MKYLKGNLRSTIIRRINLFPRFLLIVVVSALFSSCSNTKHLAEGQSLLVKNAFNIESKDRSLNVGDLKYELKSIAIQEPNKKTLGLFRLKLWFYSNAYRKSMARNDTTKFRNWIMTSVGEPPTIFEESATERSVDFMKRYLGNKGYFYNDIGYDVKTKNRKTVVRYKVETKEPFIIDQVVFPQSNSRMDRLVRGTAMRSKLKPGDHFDVGALKQERERIANIMKNAGYYFFNLEYVVFDLDSSNADRTIDVYMRIDPKLDSSDHEIFYINDIYVYPDYSLQKAAGKLMRDTLKYKDIHFISQMLRYKPRIIHDAIYLKKGRFFKKDDYDFTIKRLSGLGVFKFVNINFRNVSTDSTNLLDAYIYLTPSKKQSMSIDLEFNSNFEGLLGTGASFTYRNKNLFKNADLLTFSINTGVDLQSAKDQPLINTADVSPEINYYLNRFIVPFRLKNISRNANPKTRFSLNYRFEKRIEFYTLNSATLSFGYEWNESIFKKHILNPISLSIVSTSQESDDFIERLNNDPSLRSSFEEQLVLGGNYSYVLTTQRSVNDRSFSYFRGNVDVAGNLIQGVMSLIHAGDTVGPPYDLFGRAYSQYARLEGDFRRYWQLNELTRLVGRVTGGIGIPYGNADVLPYIKQFYSGGANSLRAFDVRSVGPGDYADTVADNTSSFGDQTGDIRLEANLELRFDVIKWIKGAIFVDVGNVWLLNSETRPQGNFDRDFYREFAIGTGLGLRLDFDFFVIRFDWAIPARDPSFPESDRWRFKHWQLNQLNFNLAIGYPF